MSERKTKRQSGAYYRKKKEQKLKEKEKLSGSLTQFLQPSIKPPPVTRTSGRSTTEVYTEEPGTFVVVLDSSSSPTEKPESPRDDSSTSESEEEISYEAELVSSSLVLADPGTWPESVRPQLLENLVKKGPVQLRDNVHFPPDETNRRFSTKYFLET